VHIPEDQGSVADGKLGVVAGFGIGTLAVVAGNAFADIGWVAEFVVEWVVGALDTEEERRYLELVLGLARKLVLVRLRSELFRFRLGRPF
jgi:hypothetical protein